MALQYSVGELCYTGCALFIDMDVSVLVFSVNLFFRVLSWLIIARILCSWLIPQANGPVVRFIFDTTEPILRPIRDRLPRGSGVLGMADWSPLIAVILLDLLRGLLLSFL